MLRLILLVAAFICALIAAFWVPGGAPPYRPHFGWLAITLWLLWLLLSQSTNFVR